MSGVVEDYVNDRYSRGYDKMRNNLDKQMDTSAEQFDTRREAVHYLAAQASDMIRDKWVPTGEGITWTGNSDKVAREEISGMRMAINDWSHEHNHRLLQEQRQSQGMRL